MATGKRRVLTQTRINRTPMIREWMLEALRDAYRNARSYGMDLANDDARAFVLGWITGGAGLSTERVDELRAEITAEPAAARCPICTVMLVDGRCRMGHGGPT